MNVPDGLADALLTMESDAIIATDRAGMITFWNPGATRIFGFSTDEAIGQSLDLIIPPNLRARHWEGFHRVMTTGQKWHWPWRPAIGTGADQKRAAHLGRIHHCDGDGGISKRFEDSPRASRNAQGSRRRPGDRRSAHGVDRRDSQ